MKDENICVKRYILLKINAVILIILITMALYLNIKCVIEIRQNKIVNMKSIFIENYYSIEKLQAIMKYTLRELYSSDIKTDFDNYVWQLLFNEINEYEDNKKSMYNHIFNSNETEKLLHYMEEKSEVVVERLDNNILMIKFDDFKAFYTCKQIKNKLKDIKEYEHVIIDLRNNVGGNTSELIKILDMFYDEGQLMYIEKGADGYTEYLSKTEKVINFKNIVILTSSNTASCSEALINSLKVDFDPYVTVIGEKTFGKNFLYYGQKFDDGFYITFVSGLMCNSKYESFSEDGIEPDVYVDDNKDDIMKLAIKKLTK